MPTGVEEGGAVADVPDPVSSATGEVPCLARAVALHHGLCGGRTHPRVGRHLDRGAPERFHYKNSQQSESDDLTESWNVN